MLSGKCAFCKPSTLDWTFLPNHRRRIPSLDLGRLHWAPPVSAAQKLEVGKMVKNAAVNWIEEGGCAWVLE